MLRTPLRRSWLGLALTLVLVSIFVFSPRSSVNAASGFSFTNFELGRFRSAEHGMIFVGLCEISEELEATVRAATGLGDADSLRMPLRAA